MCVCVCVCVYTHLKEMKACIHRKICTQMFMGALFVIALMFHVHQQVNVSVDYSITHTMAYYSEVNRDGFVMHETTCINPKIIRLRERSQRKNKEYRDSIYMKFFLETNF